MDEMRRLPTHGELTSETNEKLAECFKYADSFAEAEESTWKVIEGALRPRMRHSNSTKIDLEDLYRRITRYLRENCEQTISLQEIARMFHVSQPYVSRAFREYSGVTYKEYALRCKIELAKTLLKTQDDMMIKDVAERVGVDQSYFSTVFHRLTGMYPLEFKAKEVRV